MGSRRYGVSGQKYKLILYEREFYHEFNAFYVILKSHLVLTLLQIEFREMDPFWGKKGLKLVLILEILIVNG